MRKIENFCRKLVFPLIALCMVFTCNSASAGKLDPIEYNIIMNNQGGTAGTEPNGASFELIAKNGALYKRVGLTDTPLEIGDPIPTPTKTGYSFTGYYWDGSQLVDSEGAVSDFFAEDFVEELDEDTTITAQWEPVQSNTITLDANGGSSNFSPTEIYTIYGDKVYDDGNDNEVTCINSIPTKANSKFNGFYTASTGGTRVTDNNGCFNEDATKQITTPWATATWYAQWTPVYKVTLNKQSGTGGTSTLYAANGHGYYSSSAATTSVTSITKPTRTGYTFAGYWNTSAASGGTQYIGADGNIIDTTASGINAALALYARWTPVVSGKITLNAPGGTVSPTAVYTKYGVGVYASQADATNGTNAITALTTVPNKANAVFLGFYSSMDDKVIETNGTFTDAATTQAKSSGQTMIWNARYAYTITLDKQGGTGGTNALYTCNDSLYADAACTDTNVEQITKPELQGSVFGGYYAGPDCYGTQYIDASGALTKDGNNNAYILGPRVDGITAGFSLYACWVQYHTVTFDNNASDAIGGQSTLYFGNGGIFADQAYTQGWEDDSPVTTPTRSGYTFTGYYYYNETDPENKYYEKIYDEHGDDWDHSMRTDRFLDNKGDVILKAGWEPNSWDFTVTTDSVSSFEFMISAQGTFYVDCGDNGTLSEVNKEAVVQNPAYYQYKSNATIVGKQITHTSAGRQYYMCDYGENNTAVRTINFGGRAELYTSNSTFAAISFYDKNATTTNVVINSSANIKTINGSLGDIFPSVGTNGNEVHKGTYNNDDYNPNFASTFYGAQITEIPEELFRGKNISNGVNSGIKYLRAYMFHSTFYGCTKLTEIKPNLFKGIITPDGNSMGYGAAFHSTFYNCSSLTSIPNNLFADVTVLSASMFTSTFHSCTGITSLGTGLFSGLVNQSAPSAFQATFTANKFTSIPADLFSGISGGAQSMFSQTFSGCSQITSIPAGLFSGVSESATAMFYATFLNCSKLSGMIPSTTFAGLMANNALVDANRTGGSDMWFRTFYNTGLKKTGSDDEACPTGYTCITGITSPANVSTEVTRGYYIGDVIINWQGIPSADTKVKVKINGVNTDIAMLDYADNTASTIVNLNGDINTPQASVTSSGQIFKGWKFNKPASN